MLSKALDAIRRKWPLAAKVYLALAIVSAAAAYLVAQGWVERVDAARPDPGRPMQVVVAATPIARGEPIAPEQLRLVEVPERWAPPGAQRSVDEVAGRVATSSLAPGEVLTETRLAPVGSGPLAALVPPGLRAVVVLSGLPEGTLAPGDRVDVIATYGGARPYADTVASGLEVLVVLGSADAFAGEGGAPVAVLVSPDVAERIAYAKAFATVSIAIEAADA